MADFRNEYPDACTEVMRLVEEFQNNLIRDAFLQIRATQKDGSYSNVILGVIL